LFALSCVLVAFLLRRTRIGAYIYAIGDNPYAARVTGIPTRPIIVLQYVLAAVIGCAAGLILAAPSDSGPLLETGDVLVFAAGVEHSATSVSGGNLLLTVFHAPSAGSRMPFDENK